MNIKLAFVSFSFQKKADQLEMTTAELSVWAVQEGKQYPCIMEAKEINNKTEIFTCEIKSPPHAKFQQLMVNLSVITNQVR